MKSEVYKRKVDTRNEMFARVLDAAAPKKKREVQLRRTTLHLRFFTNDQFDALFYIFIYYTSLHVSSIIVLIIVTHID